MKIRTMRYPGDPPAKVTEMTRTKFLERHPRQPIRLRDLNTGEILSEESMGADEIWCDLCSADPGETVVEAVWENGSVVRGYCLTCATRSWFPYCSE